ncbi:MAG TPA: glycosyltransferase family 4 protein [Bryobacteraceae bacterium]|nr:glycosyltransferase family 4 protein [Bryobacteraceae bacterium]
MTVLQFGVFPPPDGGVQSNVKDIRDYLRRHGIRCGVVHLSRHRQADHDDVFYPKTPLAVMKIALSFPANIFHFHLGGQITKELLGLYGVGTCLPGRKKVLTFHSGGYPSSPGAKRAHPLRNLVFQRFDCIIAVNQQIVDMFLGYGVAREKLRLIPPYALPSEPPPAEIPESIRAFMRDHSPLLLAICLLEPEYDLPLQIEVIERVLRKHPRAGLLIIGAGSRENDLRSLIASRPWSQSILLCGNVPRPATMNIMARSDLLVRTTWYDGDAVSIREALHFSLPVVASDNGMRPPGITLIPARDIDALEGAILRRLDEPKPPRIPKPPVEENLKAVLDLYRELRRR